MGKQRLELLENDFAARMEQAQGVKGWNVDYVHKSPEPMDLTGVPLKAIAYYLPQFHPIPENDRWWGKGFTEWTNVSKAVPQFLGHYQPHLPGELGFYDLRLPDTLRLQAELAKHYGIYGFCFHHYWFGGKRLLERPVELLRENQDIDIRYCLSWANENWSRRWDGLDQEVLISQSHSPEDDIQFFDSLVPHFKDHRYITVNGLPVLLVYRLSLLPDPKATVERWRRRAVEVGVKGVYLVGVKSFDIGNVVDYGFDAAVEFPPHQASPVELNKQYSFVNKEYEGKLYDYQELAQRHGKVRYQYPCFKAVMPSWDNEARRPGRGFSYVRSSPQAYAGWLKDACETMLESSCVSDKFIFINAWNEWAEGAHLEPDRKYGYAYLHATANTLRLFGENDELKQKIRDLNQRFKRKSDAVIVLHLFYLELLESLLETLKDAPEMDVLVTLNKTAPVHVVDRILNSGVNVYIELVDNIGRDIRPFLIQYQNLKKFGYRYACKLHTKRSTHRGDGDAWRENLFKSLLGGVDHVQSIISEFRTNAKLGILAPKGSLVDLSIPEIHSGNTKWLDVILKEMQCSQYIGKYDFKFSAGSMFWFRVDALKRIDEFACFVNSFELESGQLDGTLAHTFERVFGLISEEAGFFMKEID